MVFTTEVVDIRQHAKRCHLCPFRESFVAHLTFKKGTNTNVCCKVKIKKCEKMEHFFMLTEGLTCQSEVFSILMMFLLMIMQNKMMTIKIFRFQFHHFVM